MKKDRRFFKVSCTNYIATILFDAPPVNVINRAVLEELSDILDVLEAETDLRALVIGSSNPKIFSAGADITAFLNWDRESGMESCMYGSKLYSRIEQFAHPVICALNGGAYGGGLELALACDIRVFEEDAVVALPECHLGMLPGYGGSQRLPRLTGKGFAKRMLFTGDSVTAEEAFHAGLADKIVPKGTALAAANKMAERIAGNAPRAVSLIKQCVAYSDTHDKDSGLIFENECVGVLCGTQDKTEGARAFVEKREPHFRNV